MKYDPDTHHRRSIRLRGYDYARDGAYFVTLCAHQRECIFGEIVDDEMRLDALGCIVETCWVDVPKHFRHVELDEFVIMPNHLHGVLVITDERKGILGRGDLVGRPYKAPANTSRPTGPASGSLGAIIAQFKRISTLEINRVRTTPGARVWQRNYFEHVIRDESSLNTIRAYIQTNPARWAEDQDNPLRFSG